MADTLAVVNKIIPFSSVDGPGNRTAVFLQGCNFSCLYCHNPETIRLCVNCGECVAGCPTGALSMRGGRVCFDRERCVECDACIRSCKYMSSPRTALMSVEDVIGAVKQNMPYIRGITVSGGECTRQKEFLTELLREAGRLKLSCFLDSNGSLDFAEEKELLNLTDKVMLDVKAFDEEQHQALTGRSAQTVKQNLVFLARAGKLYEVRTVIVPGLFDAEQTVRETAKLLLACGCGAQREVRYKLISYRPMGVREPYRSSLTGPDRMQMEALSQILEEYGWQHIVIT